MRAAVVLVAAALISGCDDRDHLSKMTAQPDSPTETHVLTIEPLAIGPVAFFQSYCARCHGDFGWSFAQDFTQRLTDDELHERVQEMVIGPAGQSLGERELRALVDLHKAIDAGDPGSFAAHIVGGAIDALPETQDAETLLQGCGAWAWTDGSGRISGEIDPRQ